MVFCSITSDVGRTGSKEPVRTSYPNLCLEWAVVFVELFAVSSCGPSYVLRVVCSSALLAGVCPVAAYSDSKCPEF